MANVRYLNPSIFQLLSRLILRQVLIDDHSPDAWFLLKPFGVSQSGGRHRYNNGHGLR